MTSHWTWKPVVILDTEATGTDPHSDRIVSAYISLLHPDGIVSEALSILIDPGVPVPEGAQAVHGLSTEHLRKHGRQPREAISELLEHMARLTAGHPLVAYNAGYDLSLVRAEADRYGLPAPDLTMPVIDPLALEHHLLPGPIGKRTLTAACARHGIDPGRAHNAYADAVAAGRLARRLGLDFRHQLPETLAELHQAQVGWHQEWAEGFAGYLAVAGRKGDVASTWPTYTPADILWLEPGSPAAIALALRTVMQRHEVDETTQMRVLNQLA